MIDRLFRPPTAEQGADGKPPFITRLFAKGWDDLAFGLIAIFGAFLVVGVLMIAVGFDPLRAFAALVWGSLGSVNGISETLVQAIPLLLAGLGVSIAFRAGMWNIGVEGQLLLGAIGAAVVALYLPAMPRPVHLVLMMAGGMALGAAWGAIPGYLRARWGANEIVVTIMMNYLALLLLSYLVSGPMRDTTRPAPVPRTALLPNSALLPRLLPPTRLHAGILIAVAATAVIWFLLHRTSLGYELKATGSNRTAASYGGIDVVFVGTMAMILSGGMAGLAGMNEVAGIYRQLIEGMSSGYGYLAIAVALFGGLNPLGVVLSSLFFGALLVGADSMQRAVGVPMATVYLLQGLVLIFVLARRLLRRN